MCGGKDAAAIGGGKGGAGGKVTVLSCGSNALIYSETEGAAIGGGLNGAGGTFIFDPKRNTLLDVESSAHSAAIGGGKGGAGGTITIKGNDQCRLRVNGGQDSAALGGGEGGAGGTVEFGGAIVSINPDGEYSNTNSVSVGGGYGATDQGTVTFTAGYKVEVADKPSAQKKEVTTSAFTKDHSARVAYLTPTVTPAPQPTGKQTTTLEPWFDYIVDMDPIATNGVSLTGGKECAAGTVLKLNAKAPKVVKARGDEWVFAGWYSEKDGDYALNNGTQDWRLASGYKFTSLTNDVTLYARFVPKSMDWNVQIVCKVAYDFTPNVQTSVFVQVTSYSKPTVTATSLPKGMKWDANILAFTGKPTVPDDSKICVIKAYNATTGSKAAVTAPVVLHVCDARSPNLPMLKYDEGYVFIPGDTDLEPVLGSELLNELGLGGWTVSGLPAGMKWDSKKNTITGAATKELTSYTVKFTNATNKNDIATVAFRTTAFPVTTLEPWFDYCELDPVSDAIATNGVKLTGGKACAAGTALKLSATAPKKASGATNEWVFAGWYSEKGAPDSALNNETQDWRLASGYKFTSLTKDTTIFARFVPKSEEAQYVKVECFTLTDEYKTGVEISPSIPVEVTAYTLPTVKVTGLPAGLKFTDKDVFNKTNKIASANTIYGTPTKSGVYVATVTMTTAGKATAATTVKFIVRKDGELKLDVDYDALLGKVTGAGIYQTGKKVTLKATANKGYVFTGWWEGDNLKSQAASYVIDEMPTNDVKMAATFITDKEDEASIVANVNGLAFSSEVLTQATNVSCGVYLEWPVLSSALTMPTTVKVSGLPSGLKFDAKKNVIYGAPTAASKVDSKGNVTPSKVKVTVTSAGKSKMEFVIELTVDPLPAWAVGNFDGYHMEFGVTNGTFTATVDKTGKVSGKTAGGIASTTFSAASFGKVFTLDGTNLVYAVDVTVSYKDPETKKTVKTVDTLYLMEDLGTGLGVIGGGDTNGCGCVGIQRAWDRKDLELPEFDTKALKDPLVLENGITLKFGAKGKVTVGGKVKGDNGDLIAVSGSTYAMPVAWTDEANLLAQVYVYVAPKTNLKTGVSEVYEVLLTVGESGKIDKVSIAPQIVD